MAEKPVKAQKDTNVQNKKVQNSFVNMSHTGSVGASIKISTWQMFCFV